jgi:hypothetical protein
MFRILPPPGGNPRQISEVVNLMMLGKTNNTGSVTLATGGALTTTITDIRIGSESKIILIPASAAAFADTVPYGAFQDSTDQTASSTTTAYAITFDTTDYSNGVTLSNSSRINVKNAGVYNIQFSIQFKNTTNDSQDADIWFRKNGVDVDKSNSRFGLAPRKSSGDPYHTIGSLNYFVELAANDYVQVMWRVSNTGVSIEQHPADTSPTRPAVPSVILTVNYVNPSATTNIYVSSRGKGTATLTHFANSTSDKTYNYVIVG